MPKFTPMRTVWSEATIEADSEEKALERAETLDEEEWEEFDWSVEVDPQSED